MRPQASSRRSRIPFVGTSALLVASLFFAKVADASDQHVLSEIVGESTVGENVLSLRQKRAGRSYEDQYQSLVDWVLPGRSHLHFRLQGSFTPANPASASGAGVGVGVEFPKDQQAFVTEHQLTRVQVGGNLVSPAFDLVDIAKELGRLDELRGQVERIETANDADQRAQLCSAFDDQRRTWRRLSHDDLIHSTV